MSALATLTDLSGKWHGTNLLWLSYDEHVRKSESLAEIKTTAQEQFSEIRYSWAYEGQPQEGFLFLGQANEEKIVKAVWFDTWHMRDQFMVCEGGIETNGEVSIQGTYAAPSGPDWGWQIVIEPKFNDKFRFLMYNISPEDEKMPAVEVEYSQLI